ncbi:MAG TPA: SCO family protein [Pyrinomonadaceae bacterium]
MINRNTAALALFAAHLLAPAFAGGGGHAHARQQKHEHKSQPATPARKTVTRYACPMHPDVVSDAPGSCPECGMFLKAADGEKAAPAKISESAAAAAPARPTEPVAPGDAPQIPDLSVYDQQGRRLKFYTDLVKGKTVAINFVFTTCTTICPPLSATFRKVQQELGERVGKDVELISISVDPATDTPERLKGFAEKFQAGPGWTFVTGGKPEIDSLLKALGAATPDKNDHTPMILVGNEAAGKWTRTYGLAPAATLVKVIGEAAEAPTLSGASAGYFPNHVLVTQDNKPVRFYDDLVKGKVVLINFMFTTCTGVCPPMATNMAKVQSYLGDRIGRDVVILSISVDPTVDTPDKLKRYADSFKARPGWYFLTGEKQNVDWVLYKLGGYVEDKMKHSGVLIIGNESTGEWVKTAALRNPAQIAEAVTALLKTEKK